MWGHVPWSRSAFPGPQGLRPKEHSRTLSECALEDSVELGEDFKGQFLHSKDPSLACPKSAEGTREGFKSSKGLEVGPRTDHKKNRDSLQQ